MVTGGWRAWVVAVLVAAMAGAACGSDGDESVEADDATTTTVNEPAVRAATLPGLGAVVVGRDGMTLYRNTQDTATTTTCTGDCASIWPPLLAEGGGEPGGGPIGSLARPDGTLQVTWRAIPLYRYAADQAPGDAKGQGVGGIWFVVPEAGVDQPAEASTTTAPVPAPAPTTAASTATTRPRAGGQPATTAATTVPATPAPTTVPPTTPPPTTPPPTTSAPTTSPPYTYPKYTGGYCDYPPCEP